MKATLVEKKYLNGTKKLSIATSVAEITLTPVAWIEWTLFSTLCLGEVTLAMAKPFTNSSRAQLKRKNEFS